MNWRISRQRPAPNAARSASSLCRDSARIRSRFARFAHAMSSTNTDRGLEHPERRADAADHVGLQSVVSEAMVLGVRRVHETRTAGHCAPAVPPSVAGHCASSVSSSDAGVRERHAVLEAADEQEIMAAAILLSLRRIEREREPHAHALIVHVEAGGMMPTTVRCTPSICDLLADERPAAERGLPELVREDRPTARAFGSVSSA